MKEKCESYLENLAHPADILVIATPIETHYRIFSELYEIHGNRGVYFIDTGIHFVDLLLLSWFSRKF
ncbi:MAG: hypothetical protein QXL05_02510 [Archaeoglobaceae archaeon]